MAAPSAEQLQVLKQFREKVADLRLNHKSDLYMLKWFRSRDMNISAAEESLRKHLKWRKEENIDDVLKWIPPREFKDMYTYAITGMDKEGHPILIIPFGEWDVRTGLKKGRQNVLRVVDQMFALCYAKMEECSAKLGFEITQIVSIVDFGSFSMKQLSSFASLSTILDLVRRFEANYPKIMHSMYFINGFRVFQMLFALMKPLFSARTLGKLEIYTTPDKWQPVLHSRIPRDQLPLEFGGTQGGGRVSIGANLLPAHVDVDINEYISVDIPAGLKQELDFGVTKLNTVIKWSFKLADHDIGFSVNFNRDEELIPFKRYTADNEETGSLTCDKIGDYFLVFDNTYSKLRGKTMNYNIQIIEPN